MVRTVNLDVKKHAVKMLCGLKQLSEQNTECDFVIKVGVKECHAHKNVLFVGSPYFEAMFKHDTKEKREGKVEMKDVDFECVKSCVSFMYSGSFDVPDGKFGDLLHVAVMLQLHDMIKAIHEIMCQELNLDNFYEMRNIAELYGLRTLASQCEIFYQEKFLAIYTRPDFKYEDKSCFIEALKSKKLMLSESKKLDACLTWINWNPDEKESFSEMIKHIKLKIVSSNILRDLLENSPMIRSDLHLCKLFHDASADISNKSYRQFVLIRHMSAPRIDSEVTLCGLRFYDSSTNEVGQFHDDVELPNNFTVISVDTYIYVLSDQTIGRFNFMDKSSPWERMNDMLVDHGGEPPVVSLFGSLFLIAMTSYGCEEMSKDVERFDPDENKWIKLKDKPQAISNPNLVSLDDSIYCIGGCTVDLDLMEGEDPGTNVVCRFTPATSEWIDLEPMRVAREHCGTVAVGQKIYVIGWKDSEGSECYDVKTGQWTPITSPMVQWDHTSNAYCIDGSIFITECGALKTMERYDIESDSWSKVYLKKKTYPGYFYRSVIVQLSEE